MGIGNVGWHKDYDGNDCMTRTCKRTRKVKARDCDSFGGWISFVNWEVICTTMYLVVFAELYIVITERRDEMRRSEQQYILVLLRSDPIRVQTFWFYGHLLRFWTVKFIEWLLPFSVQNRSNSIANLPPSPSPTISDVINALQKTSSK